MYRNFDADVKKEALDALRPMTRDARDEVRRQAVAAVAYADGERAVPLLIEAAEDSDLDTRDIAISRLGRYKAEKAVGTIAKALGAAKDDEMETPSLALARIGTREATKALGANLERMDRDLSRRVLREVVVAKEPDSSLYNLIAPALASADRNLRSQAIAALGRMGDKRAVEPLAKIANEDPELHMRDEATCALARVDEERAMKPYLALRDKEDEQRDVKFSQYIEGTHKKGVIAALMVLLMHPTNAVRHQVCYQLGRIGDPRPAKLLLEIYSSEKPSIDRNLLGDTLRKMGIKPPPVPKRPVPAPATATSRP